LFDDHDSSYYAPILSPNLTGIPTTTTPTTGDNSKRIANTEFVQNTVTALGAGDMTKSVYDTNNNGIIDNAEKLNGQDSSFYTNTQITSIQPTNQRTNDLWLEIIN